MPTVGSESHCLLQQLHSYAKIAKYTEYYTMW